MKFVSVIALGLLSTSAFAASFDCQHPNLNPVEKVICEHPRLSELDDQLALAYKAVRDIPEVKDDQKKFIKYRNAQLTIENLVEIHEDRIVELKMIAELEAEAEEPIPAPAEKRIRSKKPIPGNSEVVKLINQLRTSDKVEYKGLVGYSDYRDESGPYWMVNCAYQIVRNDVAPAWISEARKYGVMKEFKAVERKFDIAFYNITVNNLKQSPWARDMCSMINSGIH